MSLLRKIYNKIFYDKNTHVINEWVKSGKPSPPPHIIKQLTINKLRAKFRYNLFIETGTYMGDMVQAQKNKFKRIYSIELDNDLFIKAVDKFKNKKNIKIIKGDSSDVLLELRSEINEPAIFWLDGHYSAGITAKGRKYCPINEELSAIFSATPLNHILLIDDSRLFIGKNDYPTIDELSAFIKQYKPNAEIYIENDIIHVFIS